jgi:endonuclease/exonuclease/phosphatase family metal-dependent hydrolase
MSLPTRKCSRPSSLRRSLIAGLALLVCVGLVGCTSDSPLDEPGLATGDPMELDVLVYNIEYAGDDSTDTVIRELDADIVGVLESYNRLPEIAEETGYPYYNVGLQILSKYPIHEPSGADGLYSLIEVQPGYVVAFFNTHLDYVKYGPNLLVNRGFTVEQTLASEDVVRTSSMQNLIPSMDQLAQEGYPVFLTGDFNQPSSLDYAEETVGTRPGIAEPVAWTVSEALFEIGFRDTFREIHPDPLENPGFTHDNPGFRSGGAADRIDYAYAGGPTTTLSSKLVGESDGPNVEIPFDPWTSDHRAVLASFSLTPVALPLTLSLDRRMLTEGDEFTAYYNAPGSDENTVAVLTAGGDPSSPLASLAAPGESGTLAVDTADLDPAGYDIVLLDAEGDEIARNSFWVRSQRATVRIETSQPSYPEGTAIEVTWDDGPANRWDWIGVYRAEAANPKKDDYLLWGYTGGHDSGSLPPTVAGAMTMGEDSQGKPWPLPPGEYVVHYLLTDQYNSAGSTPFEVTPTG